MALVYRPKSSRVGDKFANLGESVPDLTGENFLVSEADFVKFKLRGLTTSSISYSATKSAILVLAHEIIPLSNLTLDSVGSFLIAWI